MFLFIVGFPYIRHQSFLFVSIKSSGFFYAFLDYIVFKLFSCYGNLVYLDTFFSSVYTSYFFHTRWPQSEISSERHGQLRYTESRRTYLEKLGCILQLLFILHRWLSCFRETALEVQQRKWKAVPILSWCLPDIIIASSLLSCPAMRVLCNFVHHPRLLIIKIYLSPRVISLGVSAVPEAHSFCFV